MTFFVSGELGGEIGAPVTPAESNVRAIFCYSTS